jgi:hypothetical protein
MEVLMIADCEICERKQVPCTSCEQSQRMICFICQGDVFDPYGEIETPHPNIDFVIASAREYVKRNEVRYGDKVAYNERALMVKNLLDHISHLQRRADVSPDDREGMQWWNDLRDEDRQHWMRQAGNTGRAVDAWRAFKIQMRR